MAIIAGIFVLGAYFTSTTSSASVDAVPIEKLFKEGLEPTPPSDAKEGLTLGGPKRTRCPNILVQRGSEFYLYNSKVAKVPGVNPIRFKNLEDYSEFMDWLRSKDIRCPVLFLQYSYDTQGNAVYRIRPGPQDLQGGLPPNLPYSTAAASAPAPAPAGLVKLMDASRDDPPYNSGSYPGFDALNSNIGDFTTLDQMDAANTNPDGFSDNAMDPNWGGILYTQTSIDSGKYADRTRKSE